MGLHPEPSALHPCHITRQYTMSSKSSLLFNRRSQNSSKLPAQPASTDPWEHALALYVKDLDPLKQQKFQAPTTVDECLEAIVLNGQKRRSFTRNLEFLRPLIDPLKRFESAIDVVVQVNAGIASPIWGPLRVAITVSITRTGDFIGHEVVLTSY
jgi:hypothetical protein